MPTDNRADPVLVPRRGALLLLLPMLAIPVVFVGWAIFLWRGTTVQVADGARVAITLDGCTDARAMLEARAQEMGLAFELTDRPGGFTLVTTLPADPDAARQVPVGLTMPGALEVRTPEGSALLGNDGITDATMRLDLLLQAATLLRLTPAANDAVSAYARSAPDGEVEFWIDGARAGRGKTREMSSGELELWPDEGTELEKLHLAAARGVALDHLLPCPVRVGSTEPAP